MKVRRKDLPVRKFPTTLTTLTFMPAGTCWSACVFFFGGGGVPRSVPESDIGATMHTLLLMAKKWDTWLRRAITLASTEVRWSSRRLNLNSISSPSFTSSNSMI